MNTPRIVLNGFTAAEVRRISGLSIHMIDYLARENFLTPTYDQGRIRGKIRYYSYRDLVVARIVQGLRQRGIELKRLKKSIQQLSEDITWFPKDKRSLDMLVTDGRKLYYHDRNSTLVELAPGRQRSFAFVIDLAETQEDVKKRITRIQKNKIDKFTVENRPLIFVDNLVQRKKSAK